jgi:hypothetical protein
MNKIQSEVLWDAPQELVLRSLDNLEITANLLSNLRKWDKLQSPSYLPYRHMLEHIIIFTRALETMLQNWHDAIFGGYVNE